MFELEFEKVAAASSRSDFQRQDAASTSDFVDQFLCGLDYLFFTFTSFLLPSSP
jgi:hypothetical protein